MREILFRGKCKKTGEWVIGSLIVLRNNYYITMTDHYNIIDVDLGQKIEINALREENDFVEVDLGTVGEFTGICDKNGKKIFEGDIVLTQVYRSRPYSYIPENKEKRFFGVVEYVIRKYDAILHVRIDDKKSYNYPCCAWSDFYDSEVVGNIHDNPELLEGV